MALVKKTKKVNDFINAGGTAPKKEKNKDIVMSELYLPSEFKKGLKSYAAMRGEKLKDVITEIFMEGCKSYKDEEGFPKVK